MNNSFERPDVYTDTHRALFFGKAVCKLIHIRMTEGQYRRFQRYLALTHLRSTAYFRHLIHGNDLKGRSNELNHAIHASLNKVYSNVWQIVLHQRAGELDADAVAKIRFLADKLCEEVYLLAGQK